MTDDFGAALDQALRALEDAATIVATYFKSLLRQGFERGEALELARDYQDALLNRSE